jgi:hypothetical protein
MAKSKKAQETEAPQHGGFSGLHVPQDKLSKTAGSEPYSIEDAHNSTARSGLQPRKKK